MTKIQETLNSLQPYLIGIRYLEGNVLVDVVLKTGWSIIESNGIKAVKGDESLNYYMFYSELPQIGLDELLVNVRKIINLNLEREKKQELLNSKIIELKKLFKQTDLKQLDKLKFTFADDELYSNESYELYSKDEKFEEKQLEEPIIQIEDEEEILVEEPIISEQLPYLDEHRQPIELTEEDREILEEEARAERNLMMTKSRKRNSSKTMSDISQMELPPRTKNRQFGCDCGPDEACGMCIDSKDY